MHSKYINPKLYLTKLLRVMVIYLSPLISVFERKVFSHYSELPLMHQPVFIIGAPRTGSTILYQIITNELDVLYIDNLACSLHRNLFFGVWLSRKIFKSKPHNNFKAEHGNTSMYGAHAPSECGGFWYRWMPKNRHFVDEGDIDDKAENEIRREITSIINCHDKPLVFKNLNAGLRMRVLFRIFPKAKFIWIKRDPLYVTQSILKARGTVNANLEQWWSLMPENYESLKNMTAIEQVVGQVHSVERQIEQDKNMFSEENILSISYEELNDIDFVLARVHKFVGGNTEVKVGSMRAQIVIDEKDLCTGEMLSQLKDKIDALDWNGYTS